MLRGPGPERFVIAASDSIDSSLSSESAPTSPLESPPATPPERGGLAPAQAPDWLRLQRRFAFVPERVRDRLERVRDPRRVLNDPPSLPPGLATSAGGVNASRIERDVRALERIDARLLPFGHPDYPARLAALADAPPVLLVRGDPRALGAPAIAIVGARAATRAARTHTRRLARGLAARGLTIVSGLARGIDAEAHRGALEAGGVSVGVLACGIDQTYPPEHRALAEEVAASGAVVSEMPLGTSPRRELFPLRNRIISGLCQGVIVSEARARSGSLITVRHALEQGREVFVLPGALEGPFAVGSNRLLRDGARAILSVADVLEDLGWTEEGSAERPERTPISTPATRASEPRSRDALEGEILRALADEPLSLDALTERIDAEPAQLAERLIDLELDGRIGIERDGRFHRSG